MLEQIYKIRTEKLSQDSIFSSNNLYFTQILCATMHLNDLEKAERKNSLVQPDIQWIESYAVQWGWKSFSLIDIAFDGDIQEILGEGE